MFNDIHVIRTDNNGVQQNDIKVPLAYAPKNAWYAKLRQDMSSNDPNISQTWPRLAFEMTTLNPDPARKVSQMNRKSVSSIDPNSKRTMRNEIPYDIGLELHIGSKNIEDTLQIVEQILPFFQPEFNVPVKLNEELGIIKDIPFILDSVTPADNYEQGFIDNRLVEWTLSFTAKAWILMPIVDSAVIKTAIMNLSDTLDTSIPFDETMTSAVNPQTAQEDDAWIIDRTIT